MGRVNVLFICSEKYPDMDTVRQRLRKGLATEHTTYRLKSSHVVKGLAEDLGGEVLVAESEYGFEGEGLWSELLNRMDWIIVYSNSKTGIADFMRRKATEWPYDLIFGHKIDLNFEEPKKTRRTTRRAAE